MTRSPGAARRDLLACRLLLPRIPRNEPARQPVGDVDEPRAVDAGSRHARPTRSGAPRNVRASVDGVDVRRRALLLREDSHPAG